MFEHAITCPYCWETIAMLLDPSTNADYVEDCQVCCNPIEVSTNFERGELVGLEIKNLGQ